MDCRYFKLLHQSLAGGRKLSRRGTLRPCCPWWGAAASPATTRTPATSATGYRWRAADIFTRAPDIFTRPDILQGIYNEHGVCLTVNNIDISINSSTPPENVNSSKLCKIIMCNFYRDRFVIYMAGARCGLREQFEDNHELFKQWRRFEIQNLHQWSGHNSIQCERASTLFSKYVNRFHLTF